jgi:hypothetical protein
MTDFGTRPFLQFLGRQGGWSVFDCALSGVPGSFEHTRDGFDDILSGTGARAVPFANRGTPWFDGRGIRDQWPFCSFAKLLFWHIDIPEHHNIADGL